MTVSAFLRLALQIAIMIAVVPAVLAGESILVNDDNAGANTVFDSTSMQLSPWERIPDGDLDACRTYLDGKTELVLSPGALPTTQAHLLLRAFDVDSSAEPDQGYAFPEQDNVLFNNRLMGQLSGDFQEWSTQLYPITLEETFSENLLAIDIDILGQQAGNSLWCVALDWGQLLIDGGQQDEASIQSLAISNVVTATDAVTLSVTIETQAIQAGDYHLELSLIDQNAAAQTDVVGTFNEELKQQTAGQITSQTFFLTFDRTVLTSGYYGLQALLFNTTFTANNTWPTTVQDLNIAHFYHNQNTTPSRTLYVDSDGDALLDGDELNLDSDGDGILDAADADDDGDGLSTRFEHQRNDHVIETAMRLNTDGDVWLNYLDIDDDNDGVLTESEGGRTDSDSDGVLDYLDAANQSACYPNIRHDLCDADNDGEINRLDLDDDGDGIEDISDSNIAVPAFTNLIISIPENERFVMDLHDGNGTDLDADGDVITYHLSPELDHSYLELNSTSGELNFVEVVDFESGKTTYTVNIVAQANGDQTPFSVTINILNLDDESLQSISDGDDRANQIYDNALAGSEVGITALAQDPDGDDVTYVLLQSGSDRFVIDDSTGVITVGEDADFNYEEIAFFDLVVKATSTDQSGEQTATFRVNVEKALADTDGDGVPDISDDEAENACVPNADTRACAIQIEEERQRAEEEERLRREQETGTLDTGNNGLGAFPSWALFAFFLLLLPYGKLIASPWYKGMFDEMDIYVGGGTGSSALRPETSGTRYQVESDNGQAWKLTAGWDWTDELSIEGYYGDLGEASFVDSGTLNYQVKGASLIQQKWIKGGERRVHSIAAMVKGGANMLTNEGRGVSYERNSFVQPYVGLGAEYYLPRQYSVRAEYEWFGTDAALMSLSLVKRFGFRSKSQPKPIPTWDQWAEAKRIKSESADEKNAVRMIESLPPTAAIRKRIVRISPVIVDADRDGVLDDEDMCLHSSENVAVDRKGCVPLPTSKP